MLVSSGLPIFFLREHRFAHVVDSVGRGNSSHTKMWGISSHCNLQKNQKR